MPSRRCDSLRLTPSGTRTACSTTSSCAWSSTRFATTSRAATKRFRRSASFSCQTARAASATRVTPGVCHSGRQRGLTPLRICFVFAVGGREFAESLAADVQRLLVTSAVRPIVRKKAALCLLRLFRRNPDVLNKDEWCAHHPSSMHVSRTRATAHRALRIAQGGRAACATGRARLWPADERVVPTSWPCGSVQHQVRGCVAACLACPVRRGASMTTFDDARRAMAAAFAAACPRLRACWTDSSGARTFPQTTCTTRCPRHGCRRGNCGHRCLPPCLARQHAFRCVAGQVHAHSAAVSTCR